jgi:uncharacterized protein
MIDYLYFQLQNPWWDNVGAIDKDEKIREFDRLKYQYQPQTILNTRSVPGDIHLITGPRQTGKSTAVKLYIRQLLKRKTLAPQSVIYFSCDALSGEKDVIDLVVEFNKLNNNQRAVIILDEITSVSNWTAGIKWLADTGLISKSTLFLTGSSSINLKKSGEYLPGRRGQGKDIKYLPISFYELLLIHKEDVEKIPINHRRLLFKLRKMEALVKKYHRDFLFSGGFLKNINYGLTENNNDLYIKTLKSELFKAGKKEDSLREVIRKILNSLTSQSSYTNIAEEAELGSKNTAIDYLNFLSDSFFLKEVKFYDLNRQKTILKKNKKFYTIDPYIVWLFEGFVSGNLNFALLHQLVGESAMAENFVASELVKSEEEFFFFQNSRELDFYLPKKGLGIEVKYKDKITSEDLKPLAATRRKILVSKNTLAIRDDVIIVPVYLFPLIEL